MAKSKKINTSKELSLEEAIKNAMKKNRRVTTEQLDSFFGYFNRRLSDSEVSGSVVAVLDYDRFKQKINCYGQHLQPEYIHSGLNMSIGVKGSRITGHISYPDIREMNQCKLTAFVPAAKFGIEDKDAYVALVNVPIDSQEEIIRPKKYKLGSKYNKK